MAPDDLDDCALDARPTLLRLLADHGRGAAMYGSGFSMHLPMVLIALYRMGASSARLETIAHVIGVGSGSTSIRFVRLQTVPPG